MRTKNQKLKTLFGNSDRIYFVHYSCQNLSDDNEGYSPRITSIAVLHMSSDQMGSFSMHIIAEEMNISRDEIFDRYDEIEELMLRRFFAFAEAKRDKALWIHWNMTNINYGFEALEHRYRILTNEEPYHIDEANRFNLPAMIREKYGANYAKDPKMQSLMELNGGPHRDFLTGIEEVTAFKAKEFLKMHKSTIVKVYFFRSAFVKAVKNDLRTETNQFRYRVNALSQNPVVQILGIIGVLGTLASLIFMFINVLQ